MATVTVTLRYDGSVLRKQVKAFKPQLSGFSKQARNVAIDEFQRLLSKKRFLKIEQLRNAAACRAGEIVVRPRILRARELFAAALRAADRNGFKGHRRAPVCAKGLRKSKASTGRPAS